MVVRFNRWIQKLFLSESPPRKKILRCKGTIYDLKEIYTELNQEYFQGKLTLNITWFGTGETFPKTQMLFGSYDYRLKLIKINRLLDRKEIPEYFIRFIIYHEMLHDLLPPKRKLNGRRSIHHRQFKEREKVFKEFSQAQNFLKEWKKTFMKERVRQTILQ